MAYTKQTWETGETITAAKLNHMEDGISDGSGSGGVFNVNASFDEQIGGGVLDKTWQEIYDASKNGALVVVLNDVEDTGYMYSGKQIVYAISYEANSAPEYRIYAFHITSAGTQFITMYQCASSTDFPHEWHND